VKTLIVGDIHCAWAHLYDLIESESPDQILQVGDFGYWPSSPRYWPLPKGLSVPVYFCDGNHEDHWALRNREMNLLDDNLTYMPRGSTMELSDGRKVLFFGGGASIDRHRRIEGVSWFREEVACEKDLVGIEDVGPVDIVISHTAPSFIDWVPDDLNDPTRKALDVVFEECCPSQWFFGHYHWRNTKSHKGCEFSLLDMAGHSDWWEEL